MCRFEDLKIAMIAGFLATGLTANAQQPLTHTQHGQLRTVINPAASLLEQGGAVSVIGRRQWVGLDGAPTLFWGSGHVGLKRFGATAGVNIRHERLAVEKLSEASAFFAKSVRISESEYVGLSLNAGLSYMDGRFSQLDPMDPAFREDVWETDALVGFGVMLYRPDKYYVGLSLPRLMLSSLGVTGDNRYQFRNYTTSRRVRSSTWARTSPSGRAYWLPIQKTYVRRESYQRCFS